MQLTMKLILFIKQKMQGFFSAFRNIFLSAVVQTRRYIICYAFCDAEMRLLLENDESRCLKGKIFCSISRWVLMMCFALFFNAINQIFM